MNDTIEHNGVTYYHFTCLSDFAGNSRQPGYWADMWVQENQDWDSQINEIVKQTSIDCRFPDNDCSRKSMYYPTLHARLNAFYMDKAKGTGSYLITLGGAWSYYIEDNSEVAKAFDAMPKWVFESNKSLLNALTEESVCFDKVFKAIGMPIKIS